MPIRKIALFALLLAAAISAGVSQSQGNSENELLAFINQSVDWYRHVQVPAQLSTDPSDSIYSTYNRNASLQTVSLIFDFAIAQAQQSQLEQAKSAPQVDKAEVARNLPQLLASAQDKVKQANSDLESLQKQESQTAGKKRLTIDEQIAEEKSELELAEARLEALQNMSAFATSGTSTGLLGKINELERTVPEIRTVHTAVVHSTHTTHAGTNHNEGLPGTEGSSTSAGSSASGTSAAAPDSNAGSAPAATSSAPAAAVLPFSPVPMAAPAATSTPAKQPSNSILSLAEDLFALTSKLNSQRTALMATTQLRASLERIRGPLRKQLLSVTQRGDELSAAPQSSDPAVLADRSKQIDALATDYKQLSAIVLPLAKASILLDASANNLTEWRSETEHTYSVEGRMLLVRVGAVVIALIMVLVGADFWRRAIFRYIRDQRRRNQFLLLRRIVVAVLIALILIFALSTEIGSLATFAGFLTAGIAVALQNVILSVAAYFFLIGRYGIRVGDRVQIGEVTGDVVDVGLVRLHLVELDTSGGEARPTGRIVVFSNSVVFQPSSNFFRQLPGSNFAWRRISLTLASDVDYALAQEKISAAVAGVYNTYKPELDSQHRELESSLAIHIANTEPQTRLRLEAAGLEIVILYPVVLTQATQIDDRMTHALLDAIEGEPRLRLVGGGLTNIKPVDATPNKPVVPA